MQFYPLDDNKKRINATLKMDGDRIKWRFDTPKKLIL